MKTARILAALAAFILVISPALHAQTCHEAGPEVHALAPIGVMGSHTHSKGDLMLSYRYMGMGMDGNLSGTEAIAIESILQRYMMAPEQMTMQMHMLGAMYAFTDRLTLMAMANYQHSNMDMMHKMQMGDMTHIEPMTMSSSGLSDTKLTLLYRALQRKEHCIHLGAGMSLPTGSIDVAGEDGQLLSYPMQLGSGSYDALLKVNYSSIFRQYAVGAQANASLPLTENANQYQVGNQYNLTLWGSRKVTNWMSSSVRFLGSTWENYSGHNLMLNPMMSPAADPSLRAGTRVDALAGLNFRIPGGCLKGVRLSAEAGLPLYQSLEGPQMRTAVVAMTGVQYSF